MDFNAVRQNEGRTRWGSEPIDWDRLRQSSAIEELSSKPPRSSASRVVLAGLVILGIGIPAAIIVLELLDPAYVVRTVDVARRTLSVTSDSLALRRREQAIAPQPKTAKPGKAASAARFPPYLKGATKAALRESLPALQPGVTFAEPLLIEVIDENGRHWFRGKDNKIRVTLKHLSFLSNPRPSPENANATVPASDKENFFLEVHYLDEKEQAKQDVVVLRGTIARSGALTNLTVLSGQPELARQAIQVVQSWKLVPKLEGSDAVSTDAMIEVRFDNNDVFVTAKPIESDH